MPCADAGRADAGWHRLGIALNVATRLWLLYFLGEVLLFPEDPRFAGKAIPVRNLVIVVAMGSLFPALHFWLRPWKRYPLGLDLLFLSIFWLDMAGNSFNLYDTYYYFDLVPHFHGTGAATVVLWGASRLPAISAAGLATIAHVALEVQEYYTDVLLGTHNVGGAADVVNDLAVGLLATAIYAGLYALRRRSS